MKPPLPAFMARELRRGSETLRHPALGRLRLHRWCRHLYLWNWPDCYLLFNSSRSLLLWLLRLSLHAVTLCELNVMARQRILCINRRVVSLGHGFGTGSRFCVWVFHVLGGSRSQIELHLPLIGLP